MRKNDDKIDEIHTAILGTADGSVKGLRHEVDTMILHMKHTTNIAIEGNERSKKNEKSDFKRKIEIRTIGTIIIFGGIISGIIWRFF